MARIRTIKPEFFTSEDIVTLSPLARLLYIALWCEADKAGRMVWKPRTFKLRYMPGDNCDVEALCAEIVGAGLVVLYGDGLAVIPRFARHQHINPRESDSVLPCPPEEMTRGHASARVTDAQGGREGKGKEGKETHTLARDWKLPKPWGEWAIAEFPHWTADVVRLVAGHFRAHHVEAGSSADDWRPAWEKWCYDPLTQAAHPVEKPAPEKSRKPDPSATVPSDAADKTAAYLAQQSARVHDPPPNVSELLDKARKSVGTGSLRAVA